MNRRSLRQSQMPDTEHRKKEKERQRHSHHQYLAGEDMLKDRDDTGIKEDV